MCFASILLPRPLGNDLRFNQCIYRYSHASKRFVDVYTEVMTQDDTVTFE